MTRKYTSAIVAALFILFATDWVRADTNAADLYRQASARAISPQSKAVLNQPNPPAEQIDAMLKETEAASVLLHQAAECQQCDWQIDPGSKTIPDLAFLGTLRELATAQNMRAAREFKQGKVADALRTLNDLLLCGRRIRTIPLIVARLAGDAVEARCADQIAEILPTLDSAAIKQITDTLSKSPAPSNMDDAIAAEKQSTGQDVPAKGIETAKALERWFDAHRKMFEAALAAPHGTAKDFASAQDPTDGKPFDFVPRPQGYQLKSRATFHDRPATLTVGPGNTK